MSVCARVLLLLLLLLQRRILGSHDIQTKASIRLLADCYLHPHAVGGARGSKSLNALCKARPLLEELLTARRQNLCPGNYPDMHRLRTQLAELAKCRMSLADGYLADASSPLPPKFFKSGGSSSR